MGFEMTSSQRMAQETMMNKRTAEKGMFSYYYYYWYFGEVCPGLVRKRH
jgi:hypothetical protein